MDRGGFLSSQLDVQTYGSGSVGERRISFLLCGVPEVKALWAGTPTAFQPFLRAQKSLCLLNSSAGVKGKSHQWGGGVRKITVVVCLCAVCVKGSYAHAVVRGQS